MRFALRNKSKLVATFGDDYYQLLIASLTAYFQDKAELETYPKEGSKYEFIDVPNVQPKTDSCFQFAVVGRLYDVVTVAYYGAMG